MLALSFAIVACSSKKSVEAPAAPTKRPGAQSAGTPGAASSAQRTEVAKGPLHAVLMALRRVHFPYDSAVLSQESRTALADAASKLSHHPDVHLYVDGHSDERGTTEYNIGLGDRRANVVADYLARMGVKRDRLHVVSFGEERPLERGSDAKALAMNRRVEFRLMRGDVELVVEEGTLLDDRGGQLSAKAAGSSDR